MLVAPPVCLLLLFISVCLSYNWTFPNPSPSLTSSACSNNMETDTDKLAKRSWLVNYICRYFIFIMYMYSCLLMKVPIWHWGHMVRTSELELFWFLICGENIEICIGYHHPTKKYQDMIFGSYRPALHGVMVLN